MLLSTILHLAKADVLLRLLLLLALLLLILMLLVIIIDIIHLPSHYLWLLLWSWIIITILIPIHYHRILQIHTILYHKPNYLLQTLNHKVYLSLFIHIYIEINIIDIFIILRTLFLFYLINLYMQLLLQVIQLQSETVYYLCYLLLIRVVWLSRLC